MGLVRKQSVTTIGGRTKFWTKFGRIGMFSKEDRLKAVNLFLKYDRSYAAMIHELSYLFWY
jgi:hypothetical protein